MVDANTVNTPLTTHFKLSSCLCPQLDEDIDYKFQVPYFSAIGSLMFPMICTRPDLARAINTISRYMANPDKEH